MKNKSQLEDYDLVRRANKGDTSAFRQLVYNYKDVSLTLACSILKNEVLAEDVVQEVFIKVYYKLKSFKFNSAFTTWLYRIVVNTAYNELKKRRIKDSIDDDTIGGPIIEIEDKDHLKDEDQKHYINLALTRLRADEALVLRLFYLCELSIKEIKGITKFKPSKIKVDLHRGRDNLQFHLKQLLGEDINYLL
ncbi:MAG: sigma-70 family RNA polymerase sigma factor [Bacteroidota bacterium]